MPTCKLCLEDAEKLMESHFIPKATYKRVRDSNSRNPSPLLMSMKGEHQTSRQAVRELLCEQCEQRFHSRGEDWTLRHAAHDANSFPLREILQEHTCYAPTPDLGYFACVEVPSVDVEALAYFALSIIWRASVTNWTIDGLEINPLDLGREYNEAFRRYLLGNTQFPENVALFFSVSSLDPVLLLATFPQTRNWGDYRSHFFSIPGMSFTVNVGRRFPDFVRESCLYRGKGRPLFYTPLEDLQNMKDFNRLAEMRRR